MRLRFRTWHCDSLSNTAGMDHTSSDSGESRRQSRDPGSSDSDGGGDVNVDARGLEAIGEIRVQ